MNATLLTLASSCLMVVCAVYFFVYARKKKSNTHKEMKYRIVFTILIMLLVFPVILGMI
ncbi:DUF4059 family protein [Amphibacillus sediminis]|uniref:DUF4059 family protein n=1 Tax=Amphibacillus sediminis TaxID=360185 RepID=UPI003570FB92